MKPDTASERLTDLDEGRANVAAEYAKERAEWAKNAGLGIVSEFADSVPLMIARGVGAVAGGGVGMLAVPYVAEAASESGIPVVEDVGKAVAGQSKKVKAEQEQYNREMLDLPLHKRLSTGAANTGKGLLSLAAAPLGLGPLGDVEAAEMAGRGLVSGPLGYYEALMDPSMTVETVVADPFAALLEAAPAAGAAGAALRSRAIQWAADGSKASLKGAQTYNKAAKAANFVADVLDPQPMAKPAKGKRKRGRTNEPGVKAAKTQAEKLGAEPGSVAIADDAMRPDTPSIPTTGELPEGPLLGSKVGHAMRSAMWGAVVLEPLALATGLPGAGFAIGAAAHPAFKTALKVVAKSRSKTVAEIQSTIDRLFNDPVSIHDPDLAASLQEVFDARGKGAAVDTFTQAIAKMVELGETLEPFKPGGEGRQVPAPTRLGINMVMLPDGTFTYDPIGAKRWWQYAANATDADLKAKTLRIIAKEEKREAAAQRWALAGKDRKALKRALQAREALDNATAARGDLIERRVKLAERLDQMAEKSGLDFIESKLAEYQQFRRAADELEKAADGDVKAVRADVAELRKARRKAEKAAFIGESRNASALEWFARITEVVGPDVNPALVENVSLAKKALEELIANPVSKQWTELVDQHRAIARRAKEIGGEGSPIRVTWDGTRGKATVTYKNTGTFAKAYIKAQAAANDAHAAIAQGEPATPQRLAAIEKAKAMRSQITGEVIDVLALEREKDRISSTLDGIAEMFGRSPGEAKAAMAQELAQARKEGADALRAAKRLDAAANKLANDIHANSAAVVVAEERYADALDRLAQKNANIEALERMVKNVDRLFKEQRLASPTAEDKIARRLVAADLKIEGKLGPVEAMIVDLRGQIADLLDANGEVQSAFDRAVAAGKIDDAARKAKKKAQSSFPMESKRAYVQSGLGENLPSPTPDGKPEMVSLKWTNDQIDVLVEQIAEMASTFTPFGAPIDPVYVRRLFSMSVMETGLTHLMNKRALGYVTAVIVGEPGTSRSAKYRQAKAELSAKVSEFMAESIRTDEWIEPVIRGVPISAIITDWLRQLDAPTKREVMADTVRAMGSWLRQQIQLHQMQGSVAAEIAAQLPHLASSPIAAPMHSFGSWVRGESRKWIVPFDVDAMRKMLMDEGSVAAFIQGAAKTIDPAQMTPEMAARLTPEGLQAWVGQFRNYRQLRGSSFADARVSRESIGAVAGGLTGATVGALAAGPAGAVLGGVGGAVVGPQFADAAAPKFASLNTFMDGVQTDLLHNGYSPLSSVWVEPGVADAMDAQVAYIRNVSKAEALMKIAVTAFSPSTWMTNMLANDLAMTMADGRAFGETMAASIPAVVKAMGEWSEGKSNPRDFDKWRAFARTGLMESSIIADVLRDWGTTNINSMLTDRVADTIHLFASTYAMQDGLFKAVAFSKQFDHLERAVDALGPGMEIKIAQRGDFYTTIKREGDDLFVVEGKNKRRLGREMQEFSDIIGNGAAEFARGVFFDFGALPGLLRKRESMISAFAAPLFGWAYRALDAPGKRGILSGVLAYSPSTGFLTNDPALLNAKAAELAGLALRRSVVMQIAAEEAEIGRDKRFSHYADLLSYGIPQMSWLSAGQKGSGIFHYGDQGNMDFTVPTMTLMKLATNGVVGVMDLLGFGPETRPDLMGAAKNTLLTADQRDKAKWDLFWYEHFAGKSGSTKDLIRVLGISGSFLFPLIVAAGNPRTTDDQLRRLALTFANLTFGRMNVAAVDVFVGTIWPDSQLTTRKSVLDMRTDAVRPEAALEWATRALAGVGTREVDAVEFAKRVRSLKKKLKDSVLSDLKDEAVEIENDLDDNARANAGKAPLNPEQRAALQMRLNQIEQVMDKRGEWIAEQLTNKLRKK